MRYLINLSILAIVWLISVIINKIIKRKINNRLIKLRKRKEVLALNYLRRKQSDASW